MMLTIREIVLLANVVIAYLGIILMLVVMGPEGRFFLTLPLARKCAIFLGLDKSGNVHLHKVKAKSKSLSDGKNIFVFTSGHISANKEDNEFTVEEVNQLNNTHSLLAGRPLFCGNISTNIAATPKMQAAIAESNDLEHKGVIREIAEFFKEGIKSVNLVSRFTVDELSKYVDLGFSRHDVDEAKQEGYIIGIKTAKNPIKVIMLVSLFALGAIVAVVFIMTKTG